MSSGSKSPFTASARGGRRRPNRKHQARMLVSGAVVALVIVFAVLNTNKVKVDWIVTTSSTALIVVIVVSFLLGSIAGALFWRRRASG